MNGGAASFVKANLTGWGSLFLLMLAGKTHLSTRSKLDKDEWKGSMLWECKPLRCSLLLFHFDHQHFLRSTFVAGANLEEMNGKTATFGSATLTGCISSCLLKGTLADDYVTGASLKFMHADRASFQNTNLRGAHSDPCQWCLVINVRSGANIYSLSASKANLQGADLTGKCAACTELWNSTDHFTNRSYNWVCPVPKWIFSWSIKHLQSV